MSVGALPVAKQRNSHTEVVLRPRRRTYSGFFSRELNHSEGHRPLLRRLGVSLDLPQPESKSYIAPLVGEDADGGQIAAQMSATDPLEGVEGGAEVNPQITDRPVLHLILLQLPPHTQRHIWVS